MNWSGFIEILENLDQFTKYIECDGGLVQESRTTITTLSSLTPRKNYVNGNMAVKMKVGKKQMSHRRRPFIGITYAR